MMEATYAAKPSTRLAVYSIVEREGMDKSFWTKVGAAFKNRDGSYNIHLDALPCNGKLHMREPEPKPSRERSDRPERREGEEVRS
jgi:hypothetical protein